MATATMGLRRRVQVGSGSGSSGGNSAAAGPGGGKRPRSDNNNSPSQGNLNSPPEPAEQPAPKKSRSSARSATLRSREAAAKCSRPEPPHWSDPRPYASIAGLSLNAQAALCSAEATLPSPMAYMSTTMATFVGNATNLGCKSPSVSYLDISNMTARPPTWEEAKGTLGLAFSSAFAAPKSPAQPEATPTTAMAPATVTTTVVPKNFPCDAMFGAYQPWVIKTYGDLAKTKTITIKKYARILRTLRGEEVNSAENSKFRFWVKSKGFHVGQPEGYDAKPADRIVGRHAVTTPGLDPPLYVPTQPPHNKVSAAQRSRGIYILMPVCASVYRAAIIRALRSPPPVCSVSGIFEVRSFFFPFALSGDRHFKVIIAIMDSFLLHGCSIVRPRFIGRRTCSLQAFARFACK